MYRILLADDEGIVLDSLQFIIERNFGQSCDVRTAKSGRMAVEAAQAFSPDIAFLDIQMPGLSGLDAMQEIRTDNQNVIFVIISAYDNFEFAKKAMTLGVMDYILKPFTKEKIVETLETAIGMIETERRKRSNDLLVKEKMSVIVPLIESGFINLILFQGDYIHEIGQYLKLLDLETEFGLIMSLVFGERQTNGELGNAIGSSVKLHNSSISIREIVKEFFPTAVIGSVMVNKVMIFYPWEKDHASVEERAKIIDQARSLLYKLQKKIGLHFRMGIGNVREMAGWYLSYEEANRALRMRKKGSVVHMQDIQVDISSQQEYPLELLTALCRDMKHGRMEASQEDAKQFLFQLAEYYGDYLDSLLTCKSFQELQSWFVSGITRASRRIAEKKGQQGNTIVEKAKNYIALEYHKDISLEEVAKYVDISSYYFSKLFKEEEGKNFIEYVTELRIAKARELLLNEKISIKEVCRNVGYSDPNYFSRIFKKVTMETPTEYREKRCK